MYHTIYYRRSYDHEWKVIYYGYMKPSIKLIRSMFPKLELGVLYIDYSWYYGNEYIEAVLKNIPKDRNVIQDSIPYWVNSYMWHKFPILDEDNIYPSLFKQLLQEQQQVYSNWVEDETVLGNYPNRDMLKKILTLTGIKL